MISALPLVSTTEADLDVEAAFAWYEAQRTGLGLEVLDALRDTYRRILVNPRKYQVQRSGIRRALLRRFPYGVYFVIEEEQILVTAVLHAARDPEEWQERRR